MAKIRISVPMQQQIKVLHEAGHSIRKISLALGVSRQTVRRCMRAPVEVSTEPKKQDEEDPCVEDAWDQAIDWNRMGELSRKGVTIKQLHAEHARDVPYGRFWRALRRNAPVPKEVSLRIAHMRAERTELDYADGIAIMDPKIGKTTKTYLFCGVLPFSGYTYGEFVWTQKQSSFLESQDRMWAYFGGITPYVVVDNLRAGVQKAHRYDPEVNPTFCAYANHMGFAVLPARPYKPKDKATVEVTIGVIQRGFYQEVRGRTFYSLAELNEAFWAYLKRLNTGVMKDHGVSRTDRFAAESSSLKAIPSERFEISEQRFSKVHPDCHIQVDRNFYSVPHCHVGETVRVRMTTKLVDIFDETHESLAVHARLIGTGLYSTNEAHYPEKKLGIVRFEVRHAEAQAKAIGPKTEALVMSLVAGEYPLRYLRRIQGILRLHATKRVTAEALEYACEQAVTFRKARLFYIKACAEYFQANGKRLSPIRPDRDSASSYLHQRGGAS